MVGITDRLKDLLISSSKPKDAEADSQAHDPTLPGNPKSKKEELSVVEAIGRYPLIWNPFLNRGTNFSEKEREEKGLHGLLPPAIESLELQAERVMYQLHEETTTNLQKYMVLSELLSNNVKLFYYVVINNIKELAPIIYTPTVGDACIHFDRIYMRSLGMYFDGFNLRGQFRNILDNWPSNNVQIVVVTDGGRILGLGDLGANGMGIPIGKISLYVSGAGFHPEHSLPALLDCGTDNKDLLNDKFYLGNKKARLWGDEHMARVEEFCFAIHDKWPNCLIQFEDFNTERAFAILERMQDKVLCFNDDIQGTGAVVTAGFINGMKVQGTDLKDARILFFGAGSSAVGVAHMIAALLMKEAGLSKEEAYKHIWVMDSKGIITKNRGDELPKHKQSIAREDDTPPIKDLREAVAYIKPHAIIGLSGRGAAWDQSVIEEMAKHCEKPLIFPLSNPTDKAEVTAENAVKWTHGKCIFASGSPFPDVEYNGKKIEIGQANNVFIFPGTGFGSVMAKAKVVKNEMFLAAARALADFVPPEQLKAGRIYPTIDQLRPVSLTVATGVAEEALQLGVAQIARPNKSLKDYIQERMWDPSKKMHADSIT